MSKWIRVANVNLTFPPLASSAHCASASEGAWSKNKNACADYGEEKHTMMTGMPIKPRSFWHSALCSFVTLTCRRLNLSTSSAVPCVRSWIDKSDTALVKLTRLFCLFFLLLRFFSSFKAFRQLFEQSEALSKKRWDGYVRHPT